MPNANKIEFNLIEPQNSCGKIVELAEASFNDVIYSLNIDYFTNDTDKLYINTFGDFESYYIIKELYEIEEIKTIKCVSAGGNQYCSPLSYCDENNKKILSSRANVLVHRKKINYNDTIPLDY